MPELEWAPPPSASRRSGGGFVFHAVQLTQTIWHIPATGEVCSEHLMMFRGAGKQHT